LFEKDVVSEGVRKWFDEKVAGYKKLRGGVRVLDVLPRTPLGKVMRRELPARVESRRLREGVMKARL
jgi:4-coumarate--CoA ligase